jgi:hypothetical protein
VNLAIPSIHYLAILPVLIFFGAAMALLITSALSRSKVPLSVAMATTALAAIATMVVNWVRVRPSHTPSCLMISR